MLKVKAKVCFKPEAEGGLKRDGVSGMQPSFTVSNQLITHTLISRLQLR